MIRLRDYQLTAVSEVELAHASGTDRPAIVMATGTGKTATFAEVIRRRLARVPDRRILVLAHRVELVEQAAARICRDAPHLPVGIVKAQRDQVRAPVIVASRDTLRSAQRRARIRDVGLIITDECHRAVSDTYMTIYGHFGGLDGRAQMLGVTATMSRGDDRALGDVWQDVVYTYAIGQGIADGWLVRPRGKRVRVAGLDMARVGRTAGDYRAGALGQALADADAPGAIARAYREYACRPDGSPRPGIVFCPTVEVAKLVQQALLDAGVRTGLVYGDMPERERAANLAGLESGALDVVVNVMVLTEGFDCPRVEVCVVARPTMHHGLYVQMVGRVLRPYCPVHGDRATTSCCPATKDGALVLDVVGASQRHALTAHVELFGEDEAHEMLDDDPLDESTSSDEDISDILPAGPEDPAIATYGGEPLTAEDVDLLSGSGNAWFRTPAGCWVLAAGLRYLVVQRGPGGWDVAWAGRRQLGGAWIVRGVSSLAMAQGFAEANLTASERHAARRESMSTVTNSRDRQARRQYATSLGVTVPRGAGTGELNMLITQAEAAQRIDPVYLAGLTQPLVTR